MMYAGEGSVPTEGAKLSGVSQETEPYTDTTLESPLNGRRRCKDEESQSLRPKDRENASWYSCALYHMFCLFLRSKNFTPAFYLLKFYKGK